MKYQYQITCEQDWYPQRSCDFCGERYDNFREDAEAETAEEALRLVLPCVDEWQFDPLGVGTPDTACAGRETRLGRIVAWTVPFEA